MEFKAECYTINKFTTRKGLQQLKDGENEEEVFAQRDE